MTLEIKVPPSEDYIEIVFSGTHSYESSFNYWLQLKKTCDKNNCFKVLTYLNFENTMVNKDLYGLHEKLKAIGITDDFRLAYITHDPKNYDKSVFAIRELLKKNGFNNIMIFHNKKEAMHWLLNE